MLFKQKSWLLLLGVVLSGTVLATGCGEKESASADVEGQAKTEWSFGNVGAVKAVSLLQREAGTVRTFYGRSQVSDDVSLADRRGADSLCLVLGVENE